MITTEFKIEHDGADKIAILGDNKLYLHSLGREGFMPALYNENWDGECITLDGIARQGYEAESERVLRLLAKLVDAGASHRDAHNVFFFETLSGLEGAVDRAIAEMEA